MLNVICGDRDTGRALVEHEIPAMVSITGSVRAGIEVAASAAKDVKRVHLELGGKAPVLVTLGTGLETLPIWILNNLIRPNQAPIVNVVAAVLILASTVPVYLAQRLSGDTTSGGRL